MKNEKSQLENLENFHELTLEQKLDIQAGDSIAGSIISIITDFFKGIYKP